MVNTKRIITTRPAHQSSDWIARVTKAGFGSLNVPALAITPLENESAKQKIVRHMQALDNNDFLIFVSQNAVAFGFDWIEDHWPQFPLGPKCLAVGVKTQQAVELRLSALGNNDAVISDVGLMNSEALLAHACLKDVVDKKILIFRGQGGRTLLGDTLEQRGALIAYCELYERALPQQSLAVLQAEPLSLQTDILTVFSYESLTNFCELAAATSQRDFLQIPVVVPSDRVALQAQALGFTDIVTAENATEDAMWQALTSFVN